MFIYISLDEIFSKTMPHSKNTRNDFLVVKTELNDSLEL